MSSNVSAASIATEPEPAAPYSCTGFIYPRWQIKNQTQALARISGHFWPRRRAKWRSAYLSIGRRKIAPHMHLGEELKDMQNAIRSEEHTSELQSHSDLVCRLLLEKKK